MDTDLSKIENHFQELDGLGLTESRSKTIERASSKLDTKLSNILTDVYAGNINSQIARTDLSQTLHDYQTSMSEIDNYFDRLVNARMSQAKKFFGACDLDTKEFAKTLSARLTEETGSEWLPIRYLLRAGTSVQEAREAYGVIMADALLSLPNMTDTITLLDTGKFVPCARYDIKYTDINNKDKTEYEFINAQNMNRIWDLSSYNFLSIADTKTFNAILNLNDTRGKPFLHLYLSKNSQRILNQISSHIPTYRSYDLPNLPQSHPRIIANELIASQVAKNLDKNNQLINQR